MVEANPRDATPQADRRAELEERIFGEQDERMRELYEWCKEFTRKMMERVQAFSARSRRTAQNLLVSLKRNRDELRDMFKKNEMAAVKERILQILQSERNPESFFVGEEQEFLDEDGNSNSQVVMARFDDLEAAINSRIQKLEARHDGGWVDEMGRKITEAVAMLDRMAAQHAERE